MARLDIENLNVHAGSTHILRDVSLNVAEGDCLALLGPSGCGKTTTLRSIAGFIRPTGGDVKFDGRSVLGLPAHKRNVGLVFQDYALFPHMTVAENVAYGLRMHKVPKREHAGRVEDALEMVHLLGYSDRMPSQLSGGQQQRVALARALVIRPNILLLDEPLGALDRRLRDQMQVELKRIQREAGITTIIVTHDQEEALSLSDVVAVMFNGRIEEIGAPAKLYRNPRSRDVMGFLGTSNFIDGIVESSDDTGAVVRLGENETIATATPAPPGQAVRLGIRPERFRLTTSPPADGENVFRGTVQEAVYKGAHAEVYVTTAKGASFSVIQQDAETSSLTDAGVEIGAEIYLSVPRQNVLLFTEET